MREVRPLPDTEAASVAAEFVSLARQAVERLGRFRVALSGGSTPRRLYERLADGRRRSPVEWDRA